MATTKKGNLMPVKRASFSSVQTKTFIALTAGALAATAMGATPTANATCISAFGLASGGSCTSTIGSIAVAIGTNAQAHADGLLGAAFTLGDESYAATNVGALMNFAVALGNSNLAAAGGIASIAVVAGGTNQTVVAGPGTLGDGSIANIAVSLTGPQEAQTVAAGIANASFNIAGSGIVSGGGVGLTTVNAIGLGVNLVNAGTFNTIANLTGNNIEITNAIGTGGLGNFAFNVIGQDNVITTRGTLAVAGAFGSVGQTVAQDGPGFNISFNRQSASRASARLAGASRDAAGASRDAAGAKPTAARSREDR